jgi:hypothetical protein
MNEIQTLLEWIGMGMGGMLILVVDLMFVSLFNVKK